MKMNQNHNLFSFLSRGVTTTHPWCSVFILCFCFVFCSYSISVSASQSNIPEMTDWQFSQAINAYAGLTDDQKDIANFLTGSQGYAFAGIAQSNLNTNFSTYDAAIESVKNFGAKMWDDLQNIDSSVESSIYRRRETLQGIKNDLSNFFGNAVSYAKSRSESFSAWLGNVGIDYNSSSEFRIQFGKDQAQNNIDYFGDQGLYNWQYSSSLLYPSDFNFVWDQGTISGSANQTYYSYFATMPTPHIRDNWSGGWINSYVGGTVLGTYRNIFVDLSNNTVYLCDDYGNQAPSTFSVSYIRATISNSVYYTDSLPFKTNVLNFLNYGTLTALFDNLSANPALIIGHSQVNDLKVCLSDLITGLYVGYSWDSKAWWSADFDLNLTSTSQYVTVNAPTNVIYLDLNGFMRDLYDNPTIIYNYVINNSVDGNGDPVDPSGFEPVSKFPGIPDSGITIGMEFFKINGLNPIFGSGGYIDALWNNTKGLVLYIGDIFKVLTLDSIDGGGFAWVIYGAVSVGVIGGIFSKFLL